MTAVQIAALGELIETGSFEAAHALCEANGYRFIKEHDSPWASTFIIRRGDGFQHKQDAIKHLYLTLNNREETCEIKPTK